MPDDIRRKLSIPADAPAPPGRRTAMIAALVHKLAAATPDDLKALRGDDFSVSANARTRLGITMPEVRLFQQFRKDDATDR